MVEGQTLFIQRLRDEMVSLADEKVKESSQRFFKEEVKIIGLRASDVNRLSKSFYREISTLSKNEIFKLCETLWQSGYLEESFVACNWTYLQIKRFEPLDIDVFERWIYNYVSNWASCDTFCNHTVGDFLVKYPEYVKRLKIWAKSLDRWVRRAAAVSLIIPARKGLFVDDIFEIATILLTDSDDLVQKGYGSLLKAADQSNRELVFQFVMNNKANMPRTALRYAIEKMPPDMKERAMVR